MVADGHRGSARIFTFPTEAARRRSDPRRAPEIAAATGAVALKTYAGAWYHDVAIRDAESGPKK